MTISVNSLTSGRWTAKRQNNRDAILDAARDIFAEIGYGGTTVRHIIRRTNLASGTFYNYFNGKEAVFNALGDEISTELRQPLAPEAAAQFATRLFMTGVCGNRS